MNYIKLISKLLQKMDDDPNLCEQQVKLAVDSVNLYDVTDIHITQERWEFEDNRTVLKGKMVLITDQHSKEQGQIGDSDDQGKEKNFKDIEIGDRGYRPMNNKPLDNTNYIGHVIWKGDFMELMDSTLSMHWNTEGFEEFTVKELMDIEFVLIDTIGPECPILFTYNLDPCSISIYWDNRYYNDLKVTKVEL